MGMAVSGVPVGTIMRRHRLRNKQTHDVDKGELKKKGRKGSAGWRNRVKQPLRVRTIERPIRWRIDRLAD